MPPIVPAHSNPVMERCGKALTTPEDLARIEVFVFLGRLAEAGQVELSSRDDGDVEARFLTGEVFLLDTLNITRLS